MNKIKPYDYIISPGYIFIPDKPMVLGAVLGNGVVVTLYDTINKRGGMCHFIEPRTRDGNRGTPIYGEIAVNALINLFVERGSRISDLKAHVIGGANDFFSDDEKENSLSRKKIGVENLKVAKEILKKHRIKGVSFIAGGYQGKKVLYNTNTNEVLAASVNNVRDSDWIKI